MVTNTATTAGTATAAAAAAAAAAEEVAGLDRVLTRLALTDDDKLEKVLQKLIPLVIGQLKSPHPGTFNKVREILSHVNKRLKGLPAMQLPLADLVTMYKGEQQPGTNPAQYGMVRNFSLVYTEMAAERAPGPDRLAALPFLLPGFSKRPVDHQTILVRILASSLEHQPPPPVSGGGLIPGLMQPSPPPAAVGETAVTAAVAAGEGTAAAAGEGTTPAATAGEGTAVSAAEAALRAKYPYLVDKADRNLFLSYGLKLMLYVTRTSRAPATPLAAGQAAAAQAGAGATAAAAAVPLPPPPGLSVADVKQLEAKGVPTSEQVSRRKLGFLNLLAAAGIGGPLLPVGSVLPHLLVGTADSAEQVARRAEELLKRSAALDPNRPAANLDDQDLVRQLLRLFHGGAVELFFDGAVGSSGNGNDGGSAPATAAAPPADQVATPAGPALRSRLATVFCRSITFANTFPASLLTIQECVMPPQTSGTAITVAGGGGGGGGPVTAAVTGVFARLRQQGLELCVWVFKHGSRHQLKAMGPVVLQGLLDTLDASAPSSPGAPMDSPTMTLRGFAYQAIGNLAQRVPELLQPRIDIARRFFAALADEPPGVRAAVQEATSALSRAFIVVQPQPAGPATVYESGRVYGDRTAELDELLLESVRSPKDAVRLCAVQWACRLFPFQHVPARWVCVLAAGDNRHDVREEAARGLKLPSSQSPSPSPSSKSTTPTATSGGGGDGAAAMNAAGAAADTGRLPSLYYLVRYARKQLPRLRYPADPLAPLPLAPRAFLALIALLRMCRHVPVHAAAAAAAATATGPGGAEGAASAASQPQGATEAMDVDADPAAAAGTDISMEVEGPAAAAGQVVPSTESDPDLMPDDDVALLSAYACVLEAGLCRVEGTSEVVAAALEALLEAAAEEGEEETRGQVLARRYAPRAAWLRSFLSHSDPWARTAAAKLLGSHVVRVMTTEAAVELLTGICSQLSPLTLQGRAGTEGAAAVSSDAGGTPAAAAVSRAGSGATASATATIVAGSGAIKQEEAEGCLLAVGLITHSISVDSPTLEPAVVAAAVKALTAVLLGGSSSAVQLAAAAAPIVRATAALALSYACAAGIQPALLASAPAPPEAAEAAADMQVDAGAAAAATATQPPRILDVAIGSILDLLAADSTNSTTKDAKVASRAAAAAGFLAGGWGGEWIPEADVSRRLIDGLFGTASSKSEELQFSVGEALAWAFGGLSSVTATKVLRGNFTTLGDQLTASAAAATDGAVGGGDADSETQEPPPPPPEAETLEDGPRSELRNRILTRLLGDLVVSSKNEVRCAGAVWLVSLLGFCGRAAVLRGAELPKIQEALSGLLGDPNELTQEMASRGVSLVYRLGDAAVREQLVTRLVAVLQGSTGPGGGAGRPVKLTADTQVFEEGALGNAPGGGAGSGASSGSSGSSGGLSTYKELCALATDLGQPDLIYKFMDLAHHAAALNSRRGAAFGFAGIARLASRGGGAPGEALAKHLAVLVPKLYRYTHDPNPKVAEAMVAIWRSLVDDPRVTLDKHFAAIMADLLREMGGRLWRNRQAACSALGDLLQGRRWPELSPYLSQIWIMTFRALDDIKDSVRRAALSLARTVRGLTLRLADPAHTPAKDCCSAVAVVMSVLLEQGLMSNVAEVRAMAVEMLGLVSKTAPPPALRPLLPALVPALLEALSSLEDVRLNYVEQHAERLGLDSDRLEGARVAAARASPLGDTLDLAARLADSPCLEQLVPALMGTVKRGVGLNTKVGAARFIRNLASRPGATTVTVAATTAATTAQTSEPAGATEPLLRPHAGPLLRVLIGAVRSERSGTVRRAYAAAAAQVVRHAGEKRLDKFVAEAVASYTDPGADVESRLSGGLVLRELLRAVPEKFRMYDTVVLPAAFGAKMDEDKEVAAVWAEVWEEGVSSEPAALRLYGKEICTTLCEMLGGQQWGRKKAAADATIKLTEIAPDALGEYGRCLATALLAELNVGRLWEGKDAVLKALAALVAADPRVMEPAPGHVMVVDALMAAVGRKKMTYRKAALAALEVVLRALPGCHYERVAPPLLAAVAKHCEAGGIAAEAAAAAAASEATPQLHAAAAVAAPSSSSASSATPAATTAAAEDEGERPLPLSECISCLSAAFTRLGGIGSETESTMAATAAADAVSDQGAGLAAALRGALSAQVPWQPKLAAAAAVQVLAQRCTAAGVPPGIAASVLGPLATGLLRSAHEHKIQQLRLAALAALSALVQATEPSTPSQTPSTSAAASAANATTTAATMAPSSSAARPSAVQTSSAPRGIGAHTSAAPHTAVVMAAGTCGWSESDRRDLLPGLVSGLQQLADADKSATVVAAALGVKGSLERHLLPTEVVNGVLTTPAGAAAGEGIVDAEGAAAVVSRDHLEVGDVMETSS